MKLKYGALLLDALLEQDRAVTAAIEAEEAGLKLYELRKQGGFDLRSVKAPLEMASNGINRLTQTRKAWRELYDAWTAEVADSIHRFEFATGEHDAALERECLRAAYDTALHRVLQYAHNHGVSWAPMSAVDDREREVFGRADGAGIPLDRRRALHAAACRGAEHAYEAEAADR